MEIDKLTEAELRAKRPDLAKAIGEAVLAEHAESEQEKTKDAKIKALEEEVQALKETIGKAEKTRQIDAEIAEAKLPEAAVTDLFKAMLSEAKDADARKNLIEDRRKLCGVVSPTTPKSKEQNRAENGKVLEVTDAKSFVSAITE